MNGGNISDGPNEGSGNVTELPVKKAPPEVSERILGKTKLEKRYLSLMERFDDLQAKWLQDTNHMADKLRMVRRMAQKGLDDMRAQLEKNTDELVNARVKFEKYLMKSDMLEDQVEKLEKENKMLKDELREYL